MISPSTTVAELVLERPARARLFERLGLDYCCGGKRPLSEACARRGLDVATVVAVLETDDLPAAGDERDWREAPLAELVEHIVSVHHGYLREELPRLSTLLAKVEKAHGKDLPDLVTVRDVFEQLREELEQHIGEEEQALFPAILDGSDTSVSAFEDDHAKAGLLLARLSELTDRYDTAAALCNTHRAAVDALGALERDVHQHIHEENNILFPRAAAA